MHVAEQLVADGVALASLYGLVALGFAVIFDGTRVFHVAHASVLVIAAYVTGALFAALGAVGAIVAGCAAAVLASLVMDGTVYRPIQSGRGGLFGVFIASTGIAFLVEAAANLYGHGVLEAIPVNLPNVRLGSVFLPLVDLIEIALFAAALLAARWVFFGTDIGLRWRAAADNRNLARALRVATGPLRVLSFAFGSLLAALVGELLLFDTGMNSGIAFRLLFICVAVVTLSRMRLSIGGMVFGSLFMGLLAAVTSYLAPAWTYVLTFTIIFVFFAFLPQKWLAE